MGLDMNLLKRKRGQNQIEWKDDIAYWRKANQIHRWFVENIQEGVDDCGYYKVTKEDIKKLLAVCKEVLEKSILKEGKIKNGRRLNENGVWEDVFVDGKYIENSEIAEELLPTGEGFFFGSTAYDEYYLSDIEYTIERCEEILETFNFEENELLYTSSW